MASFYLDRLYGDKMNNKKPGIFTSDKSIGELNGKWAMLLKLVLVMIPTISPFILMWGIWVTSSIFQNIMFISECKANSRNIITLHEKHDRDYRNIIKAVGDGPPSDWRDRILKLEDYAIVNAEDHRKILVELGKIGTKVELLPSRQ